MRNFRVALAAGLLITGGLSTRAHAQGAAAAAAFRTERPIVTNGSGPRRLAVDVPLLADANQGLPDLRLLDVTGREVPYLLVSRPSVAPIWMPGAILPVAAVNTQSLKTSGFEADLGAPRLLDRFRISLPPVASYLKRVRLEGSGDRAHWTILVAEGTVFDLREEHLKETELGFAPGSYRYLRVTWDDTNSGRVAAPLSVEARVVTDAVPAPPLTTPLGVERRPGEPGRSHYRLRLPAARLPIVALAFDLGGGHVSRNASVYEARLSGAEVVPVLLGATRLQRVVQGTLSASSLELPLNRPNEPQLDLVVDDDDNPPLDIRGVSAVFAEQPWIYFEAGESALVARYGNRSLAAPRYDLEAMRDTLRTGISTVTDAAWGEARVRTPDEQPAAPARALPTAGSSIDPALFNYVRDLPVGDGGLIALSLDAAALAHSAGATGAFADVRVIDASGRQVPYLVERASAPLSMDVALTQTPQVPEALASGSSKPTVYRIALPFEHLPAPRLVLTTSARVFKRVVSVGVERPPDRHHRDPRIDTVARFAWTHADEETPAPPAAIPLPASDGKELLLIVEEGDNSPLPITSARILLPAYRLRFFREPGATLRLAYGRQDLTPPSYDLALLAPQVLGVAATDIEAAGEPAARAVALSAALVSPGLFWAALVVAVIVLLGLIARLLRKEQPAT